MIDIKEMSGFMKVIVLIFIYLLFSFPVFALDVVEGKSAGGIAYIVARSTDVPVVEMNITFDRAGSAYDASDKGGLHFMLSEVLRAGGGSDYTLSSFAKSLEEKAIGIDFSVSRRYMSVHILTLKENLPFALKMFVGVLTEPFLTDENIDRIKNLIFAKRKIVYQVPDYVGGLEMGKILYGNHPYSREIFGNTDSVGGIVAGDLNDRLHQIVGRDNMKVTVVGDVIGMDIVAMLDDVFAILPSKAPVMNTEVVLTPSLQNVDGSEKSIVMDVPQSVIMFSKQGNWQVGKRGYYEAYIASRILGGLSLSSILMSKLRGELGLTYNTSASIVHNDGVTLISGVVRTANASVALALSELKKVLVNVAKNGVDKEMFELAKNSAIGSTTLIFASNSQLLDYLHQSVHIRGMKLKDALGVVDSIKAVEFRGVNSAVKEISDVKSMNFVVVGASVKK